MHADKTDKYDAQLRNLFNKRFPDKRARPNGFAVRPRSLHDAYSARVMPNGPWNVPFRMLERLIFDAPGGIGNNPSRQMFVAEFMWAMDENSP